MGLDGLFVAGTTGEGVLLEYDEVEALAARAVERRGLAAGDRPRWRPSTRATVALARRALDAGADGVAAYVPWFYPVRHRAQVRAHFLALLEAADGAPRRSSTTSRRGRSTTSRPSWPASWRAGSRG